MRIGQGYDAHRLAAGKKLVLGGIEIPYEKGLEGHSDADVLTHAIMDALLGAAALGDIGTLFPDTDARYAGASSIKLLEEVAYRVRAAGYATLIAQEPKIAPYRDKMALKLSETMNLARSKVSIKATTEEGMGFTGAKEGMAAMAVALLLERE